MRYRTMHYELQAEDQRPRSLPDAGRPSGARSPNGGTNATGYRSSLASIDIAL
jgi:hypothetical protein